MEAVQFAINFISSILLIFAILVPGILPTAINAVFGSGRRSSVINNIFILFGFAAVSYGLLAVIYNWLEIEFPLPILGTDFPFSVSETEYPVQTTDGESKQSNLFSSFSWVQSLDDIAWTTLISLGLAYPWLIIYRKRLAERGLKAIGATDHFGGKDAWTSLLSRPEVKEKFVVVRDLANKLIYTGWIEDFSEHDTFRELVMSSVEVHDFDHKLVTKSNTVYVGLRNDSVLINFYSEERRIQSAVSYT